MAFTQSDIDTLDRAIAGGILTVRFSDGRTVTYQSLEAMLSARRVMTSEVQTATGMKRRRTFRVFQSGRGQ